MGGAVRVDRVVTSGTFALDGGEWQVDNNVWLVGDDDEVLVIDPAHDADAILAAVAGRRVPTIVCTHAHNDHIDAAVEVAAATAAEIALHPDDLMLWSQEYGGLRPDIDIVDESAFEVARTRPRGAAHAGSLARWSLPLRARPRRALLR
jgi:glyoxylase-like metal-dependent hydrolase (beta-lactamase superfamily II)